VLSGGQWCNSFSAWLKFYMQKIGGIVIDSNPLLVDPASATNGFLPGTGADNVHVSCNGGIRDGRVIAQQLHTFFRPCSGFTPSNSDQYSTTTPLSNMLPSTVSGFPGGTFPNTVALATIPKTSTPVQMGTVWVQAWSATNTGSRTITAEVLTRTDTTPDGTLIPGNELKLSFSAGSGANSVNVQFTNNTNAYIYLSSNGTNSGTPYLSIGDQFQMDVEIYIPATNIVSGVPVPNLEANVIYDTPRVSVEQGVQYISGGYRSFKYGAFSNGTALFNKLPGPGGGTASLGTDLRLSGVGENGTYKPSAVISTPPIKWIGNYNGTGTAVTVTPLIYINIPSGTNPTTVPFVVYIRGVSLRKIDPATAYPYN
jgi:hypothetical protein